MTCRCLEGSRCTLESTEGDEEDEIEDSESFVIERVVASRRIASVMQRSRLELIGSITCTVVVEGQKKRTSDVHMHITFFCT